MVAILQLTGFTVKEQTMTKLKRPKLRNRDQDSLVLS